MNVVQYKGRGDGGRATAAQTLLCAHGRPRFFRPVVHRTHPRRPLRVFLRVRRSFRLQPLQRALVLLGSVVSVERLLVGEEASGDWAVEPPCSRHVVRDFPLPNVAQRRVRGAVRDSRRLGVSAARRQFLVVFVEQVGVPRVELASERGFANSRRLLPLSLRLLLYIYSSTNPTYIDTVHN